MARLFESDENIGLKLIIGKICKLSLPMAGIQLISVASGFLCATMVAKLGAQVLAASALFFATQTSFMVIGMAILFSLSILVGHAFGARNYLLVGHYLQQSWTLALFISVPLLILFWHMDTVLIYLGQQKNISLISQQFFDGYLWAIVPILLLTCSQQFCYGIHKQKLVVFISAISIILLLISADILIFGKFGLPKLGVKGLGYAIAIQAWFSVIAYALCFYFQNVFKPFLLFHYRVHKNREHLKHMLRVGWPITLQMSGEVFSLFVCTAMMGWLGTQALAAYQVVIQYFFLILIPIFSIAQACGILVGQACGGEQHFVVKKLGNTCLIVTLIVTILVAIILLLFPRSLAALYLNVHQTENATILRYIVLFFIITAFTQIIDAVRNVTIGALRGLLDNKLSMYVSLATTWLIGIPLSYYLAFKLSVGPIGISIGTSIGIFICTIIVLYRWFKLSSKY